MKRTDSDRLVITRQANIILNVFVAAPNTPHYGLELIRETGLASGTVYSTLLRFEREGWLTSAPETVDPHQAGRPRRRVFRLTPEGMRAIQSLADLGHFNDFNSARAQTGRRQYRSPHRHSARSRPSPV